MGDWGYVVVWEFRVRAGAEKAFETVYGKDGAWALFFAKGEGYTGTELNRDLKNPRRYVTLDFWASREAYDRFRAAHAGEYKAIDENCEAMTESEVELGAFERIR